MPFYNTQSARYFFSPNGYGLHPGEAYYQNVWVLYNQVSFGITNNVSLGVGGASFPFGADATPVWMTPKVSVPVVRDKFQVGPVVSLVRYSASQTPALGSFMVPVR
ncbi:MAG: hypothetical protein H6561_11110 [Lewinellaceae bacterium]|nr:hypothetical protein [Lewinellaceae bacterium]